MSRATVVIELDELEAGLPPCELSVPTLEQLGVSAGHLLKFEFPPLKHQTAYLRLLTQQLLSPHWSRKKLERLPLCILASMIQRLWLEALCQDEQEPPPLSLSDVIITLLLTYEDLTEFDLKALVQADIQLLGSEDETRLHSYFYSGALDWRTLRQVLKAHGFADLWLTQLTDENNPEKTTINAQPESLVLYWLSRMFSYPLPWGRSLQRAIPPPSSSANARMMQLKRQHDALLNRLISDGYSAEVVLDDWRISDWRHCLAQIHRLEGMLTAPVRSDNLSNHLALVDLPPERRPFRHVILVEGTTEAVLLPLLMRRYAKGLGTPSSDFCDVNIVSAGGKNQVVAKYQELSRVLRLPIFVLLDQDAVEAATQLSSLLRPQDTLYQIAEGEFEDLYDLDMIVQTINRHYQPYPPLTQARLESILALTDPETASFSGQSPPVGRVAQFKLLWQVLGMEGFDKVHFATKLAETFQAMPDTKPGLSPGMQALLSSLLAQYPLNHSLGEPSR